MISKYFFLIFFTMGITNITLASTDSDAEPSDTSTKTVGKYKKRSGKKRRNHDSQQQYSLDSDQEPAPLLDLTHQDKETIIYDFMTQNANTIHEFISSLKNKKYMMHRTVEPFNASTAIIILRIFHSAQNQLILSKKYSELEIQELHQIQATNIVESVIHALQLSEENSDSCSNP